ncbi:MAG: hypothetical protein HYZ57_16055 [Acidobacteria bacterium]|nr:hypothetical protein [Acidobacteriota bacterium]MBI3281350.1 hypothetical protein [Acidobacteriota bacterium]
MSDDELKRKDRIITVRVSSEEYSDLKRLHREHGAPNLSEFARSAMQKAISATGIEHRVEQIDSHIGALDRKLDQLTEMVQDIHDAKSSRPGE